MILTLITHDRGQVEETAYQALTLATSLARGLDVPVHGVWIGPDLDAGSLGPRGVDVVHHIVHEDLDDYAPEAWGRALAQVVDAVDPMAVMAIGSDRGNEVMAHLGATTGLPMVANCREISTGETWTIIRTRWGGSLLEETTLKAPVKLLTVTEHVAPASPSEGTSIAHVIEFTPELAPEHLLVRVVGREESTDGVTLATAPVVVSGGRGVGSSDGFTPLEELASLLGGVVGCSRVVTNNGWRPHSDQVGQTGTVVAPDLYIACGISGAIQHWVGMMASKTILAINTDPEAPMVTKADYAVIGDLSVVVPAIVNAIEERLGPG